LVCRIRPAKPVSCQGASVQGSIDAVTTRIIRVAAERIESDEATRWDLRPQSRYNKKQQKKARIPHSTSQIFLARKFEFTLIVIHFCPLKIHCILSPMLKICKKKTTFTLKVTVI
jgi:hypothetical protein